MWIDGPSLEAWLRGMTLPADTPVRCDPFERGVARVRSLRWTRPNGQIVEYERIVADGLDRFWAIHTREFREQLQRARRAHGLPPL